LGSELLLCHAALLSQGLQVNKAGAMNHNRLGAPAGVLDGLFQALFDAFKCCCQLSFLIEIVTSSSTNLRKSLRSACVRFARSPFAKSVMR
jgi:hypothetical protein